MSLPFFVVGVIALLVTYPAVASDPFIPTAGWTVYLEAVRALDWPSCPYRFLSFPTPACNAANLWDGAGINQEFTLENVPGAPSNWTFYLKASCGAYLSYPGPCDQHEVNLWPEAGINQEWTFVPTGSGSPGEYFLIAQGRASCSFHYASFPVPCTTDEPDLVDLWGAAGPEQTWRLFPMSYPNPSSRLPVAGACADPFSWTSADGERQFLSCTGGDITWNAAKAPFNASTVFADVGDQLGGSPPPWCANGNRWAPETYKVPSNASLSVMVVSDLQDDGSHRVGYVFSDTGSHSEGWTIYSPNYLQLSPGTQGDIDPHLFNDPTNNNLYLVWKSDDNRIGLQTTRIWAQQVSLVGASLVQLGSPQVIMDSTGLWWATGFNGQWSTLVEGPEVLYREPYYYLFFAAGQYCGYNYAEGVARSTSIWGPYEKMGVPLLWAPIVGVWNGQPLRGPGHATFVTTAEGQIFSIFAAHTNDEACDRYPFAIDLYFSADWPRANVDY